MKKSDVLKIAKDYISEEQKGISLHNLFYELIKKNEGKQVTRHIEKHLPDGFSLDYKAGMFHFTNKTKSFLVAYNSDPFYNSEKFRNFDACHGTASQERIDKINLIINNPEKLEKMVKLFTRLEKSFRELKESVNEIYDGDFCSYKNTINYQLIRFAVPDSKDNLISKL